MVDQDPEKKDPFSLMVEELGDMGPMGKGIVKTALEKKGIAPTEANISDFKNETVKQHIISSLAMFLGQKNAKKKYIHIVRRMGDRHA